MATLVIQSCHAIDESHWLASCMATVRQWAQQRHYDYRFLGDEIFSYVPQWYMAKVAGKLPIATDYARLVLLQQALATGEYERVIWFDADMLIIDQGLELTFSGSCAFGQEVWVQKERDSSKYRATKNVHNAVCVFNLDCPVLPFLIQTVASIIERVEPDRIPPQMVGPKLLTALHSIAGFSLLPQVGALSPEVVIDIVAGGGKALSLLQAKSQVSSFTASAISAIPLQAVNLCASVVDVNIASECISQLLGRGRV